MLKRAICALVVFSPVLVTSFQSDIALGTGEFTKSCTNITLTQGRILEADCKTRNGRTAQTGINLNNYIVNQDGRLGWSRNGNYSASSRNCDVDFQGGRTFLMCDTRKRDNSFTGASLNLDKHIANINGTLTYE
ncbi:CVNH domain-containing protein [uncultured Nostoc sp.]|uniref:mannose-binding lectin n=1 Tax=Nostoc sp. TaxID=1180 RepID=UPI0035CC3DA8